MLLPDLSSMPCQPTEARQQASTDELWGLQTLSDSIIQSCACLLLVLRRLQSKVKLIQQGRTQMQRSSQTRALVTLLTPVARGRR